MRSFLLAPIASDIADPNYVDLEFPRVFHQRFFIG